MNQKCLVLGNSYRICDEVRTSLLRRFPSIECYWLLRQINFTLSWNATNEIAGDIKVKNLFDQFELIVFVGFPVHNELLSWDQLTPPIQFASQEWNSSIQAALLLTKTPVINRGILSRYHGFSPDAAMSLRLMESLGWPTSPRKFQWPNQLPQAHHSEYIERFRLKISPLTHRYDVFGGLRFPAHYGVDALIHRTQIWLQEEKIAGADLVLTMNDKQLAVQSANLGLSFLTGSNENNALLVDGLTA